MCADEAMYMSSPLRAGICGGPDGAVSVVLSGGYRDDLDNGETL